MNISEDGLKLIKFFEGCKLDAYYCPSNVLTIGYGHTKTVHEGMTITQEEADNLLNLDIREFEKYVQSIVKVPLKQHQFDALVSWTFYLGPYNLMNSTLLKELNSSNYSKVPSEIKRWNKSNNKVLDGLVKRREAEAKMFWNENWEQV